MTRGSSICFAAAFAVFVTLWAPSGLSLDAFLCAAPLAAVLGPLAFDWYVCEDRIVGLVVRRRSTPRRHRSASRPPAPCRAWLVVVPRGGRLLASALAVRPPPLPACASGL